MYAMSHSCQIANLAEIYETHFPGKTDGYFVDVGAMDGYEFSNVYGLAQAGWSGLLIEPMPEFAEKCRNLHKDNPKIKVEEVCIGASCGNTKLYLGGCPTINEEAVDKSPYGFIYDRKKYITVQMLTLNVALTMNYVPANFDVLSIDVEGAEPLVLSEFSWELWKPKLIIIETHIGNSDVARSFNSIQITNWFAETPYRLLQRDGLNDVYILD
jgi:FkbM family methyltransferase